MYTLYYAPDNASLVVRLALAELGAPFETRLVDRAARGQRAPDYLALNPKGLIPVLIMDGSPIHETAAILLSLSERHGALGPRANDPARPQFLKVLFFVANTLHAELRQMFYPEQFIGPEGPAWASQRALLTPRLHESFAMIDDALGRSPGPYLFGEDLSVADIYAGVCARWAQLYPRRGPVGVDWAALPRFRAMAERLERRPALIAAAAKEGVRDAFLTDPSLCAPPEGSAT